VELILSSDGGAKDRVGSFGALIASQLDGQNSPNAILVEVGGIAYGDTPDHSERRATASSRFSTCSTTLHFSWTFGPCAASASSSTTSDSAIHSPAKPITKRNMMADFDLDMQIQDTLTRLDIRTSDEHIPNKGTLSPGTFA
jgi:hypothetical protein